MRNELMLLDKITAEDNLYAAWRLVRANRGAAGTDAVGLDEFEAGLPGYLGDLRRRLRDETYLPLPLRRASLPKRDGGVRELAIPTVADRVAQRAFVNVLEGVFEPLFLPCSFGYRPHRGVAQAVEAVLACRAAGQDWILDADVQDFFPSVDHSLLMERLRRHIGDRAVLRTIGLWLEAGVMASTAHPSLLTRAAQQVRAAVETALRGEKSAGRDELDWEGGDAALCGQAALSPLWMRFGAEAARLAWDNRQRVLPLLAAKGVLAGGGIGVAVLGAAAVGQHVLAGRHPRTMGTPQGGPISPLLSNVYLHTFDERMTGVGLRLVRYADDFVVCCASEARARQAREIAAAELARLRLTLHPEKTRIVACTDGLHFLGHEFDADGAFPVRDQAPALAQNALRQGTDLAGRAVRQGAAAAKSGAGAAGKVGAGMGREVAERWRELRGDKGGAR